MQEHAIAKPTPPSPKIRSHGFTAVRSAAILPQRNPQASQPFTLEVTGDWLPAGILAGEIKVITKTIAQGKLRPLQEFAAANNLPIKPF